MITDKSGHVIKVGQIVLTDEAGWKGVVVRYGDYYAMDKSTDEEGITAETLILIDEKGGYSLKPNWKACKIIGRNFLVMGREIPQRGTDDVERNSAY